MDKFVPDFISSESMDQPPTLPAVLSAEFTSVSVCKSLPAFPPIVTAPSIASVVPLKVSLPLAKLNVPSSSKSNADETYSQLTI